jgi:hypothetical protein
MVARHRRAAAIPDPARGRVRRVGVYPVAKATMAAGMESETPKIREAIQNDPISAAQ